MKITVAGVVKEVKDNITISELIAQENVETPEYVTVSVNDEFAKSADFETCTGSLYAEQANHQSRDERGTDLYRRNGLLQLRHTGNRISVHLAAACAGFVLLLRPAETGRPLAHPNHPDSRKRFRMLRSRRSITAVCTHSHRNTSIHDDGTSEIRSNPPKRHTYRYGSIPGKRHHHRTTSQQHLHHRSTCLLPMPQPDGSIRIRSCLKQPSGCRNQRALPCRLPQPCPL